jgi:uncharacterized protein (TIGR02646 family)
MILVKRLPIPDKLRRLAEQELADVLKHFEDAGERDGFKFAAYKADGVAEALNEMFSGKCAYCESRISAVHPTDIEHYRPKAAVLVGEKPEKPGYYWLAAHWENLLASCIFCNRPNRHELIAGDGKLTQGKGSHFPLLDERHRVRSSREDHSREVPLILDPCGKRDPRDHLQFMADGWIEPREGPDGQPSPFGTVTINILALRRPGLVADRREQAIRILGEIRHIEELSDAAAHDNTIRYRQGEHLEKLASFLGPDECYVGLAKDMIDGNQPGLVEALPDLLRRFRSLPKPPAHPPCHDLPRALRSIFDPKEQHSNKKVRGGRLRLDSVSDSVSGASAG